MTVYFSDRCFLFQYLKTLEVPCFQNRPAPFGLVLVVAPNIVHSECGKQTNLTETTRHKKCPA